MTAYWWEYPLLTYKRLDNNDVLSLIQSGKWIVEPKDAFTSKLGHCTMVPTGERAYYCFETLVYFYGDSDTLIRAPSIIEKEASLLNDRIQCK